MNTRKIVWLGCIITIVYLCVATISLNRMELRPLFDGIAPPPTYNYVEPPEEFAKDNRVPPAVRSEITMTPEGSESRTVSTDDGQAIITLGVGTFSEAVAIDIVPLRSPAEAEPPRQVTTNAYRITATANGREVQPTKTVTLFLTYPTHADQVLRLTGSEWKVLPSEQFVASFQIVSRITEFGTFAGAGESNESTELKTLGLPLWLTVAILSGVAALVALAVDRFTRRKHKTTQPKTGKTKPAGPKSRKTDIKKHKNG